MDFMEDLPPHHSINNLSIHQSINNTSVNLLIKNMSLSIFPPINLTNQLIKGITVKGHAKCAQLDCIIKFSIDLEHSLF